MSEWVPSELIELSWAASPAARATLPSGLPKSRNVTLPVAVAGSTVAVSVTAWPYADGSGAVASAVVVELAQVSTETRPTPLPPGMTSPTTRSLRPSPSRSPSATEDAPGSVA